MVELDVELDAFVGVDDGDLEEFGVVDVELDGLLGAFVFEFFEGLLGGGGEQGCELDGVAWVVDCVL